MTAKTISEVLHGMKVPWGGRSDGLIWLDANASHAIEAALTAAGFGLVADATLQATDLIRDLIDPDDCSFDHHGGCQAHGYLSLQPGEMCPQLEAKAWVHNHDAAAVRGEG